MIDWLELIKNSTWIFGAALALTAFSLANYCSQRTGTKFRKIVEGVGYELVLLIAGVLFALGMGFTAERWWVSSLWMIVAGIFGFYIYHLKRDA